MRAERAQEDLGIQPGILLAQDHLLAQEFQDDLGIQLGIQILLR